MSPRAPDVPENVWQFAPKEKPPLAPKDGPARSDGDPLDQAGQAIVARLHEAATLSNQTCDRAMGLARNLSLQLHAAEGRIDQLQAELKQCQDRAARAEKWLTRIYQEIEEKLIRSRQ
jgi:outer membrane murein-binding lipoprotein Lpp